MVNDSIGDLIIQIKNAGMAGKEMVSLPYSKLKKSVADKLVEVGYVESASVSGEGVHQTLNIKLAYDNDKHKVNGVKRMSKPGRRLYKKSAEIHPVKFGRGNTILTTPRGILTDAEAREANVGGEELFIIW